MIDQKIEEAITAIDSLGGFFKKHENDLTEKIKFKNESIKEKEEENRALRERANMLEIGAKKHEKENARSTLGGLIAGAALGGVAVFIILTF